ncbi:prepilin peptidase [Paraburkholderia sp. SEWSISQ10-3 4]|jgi:prepilin peptidase CpaA|uniref:Prepilin peptidase CpaA n=1 Tax=Paraburkholderia aspalathi TaxID=1324617 RepID=A0A1I7E8W1_9BURK|nr:MULTISPECIES: prepilin peptidase [Paraburkholderia]MCX4139661.1 prepilin peptidase [Paraburkholderia aspalathi]MDN7172348.1 prepilin peptidase [Paraburkholderia sp. SEWSISQ10-3 4]MDQ6501987.1 prepilin peptidase [Paraburkholderia aspalathi]SFU20349.1 prepilin peptidase CpaA [Paraburkholderia aspalathi]
MNGVPFPVGPCVMTLVLLVALWDLQTRRIPNWLVATGLIVAIPVQWFTQGGIDGMQMWLGGMLVGGAIFLPGYAMRLMGAGDVKLMAAIGAFCGAYGALEIGLATCVIGGIGSLAILLRRRQMRVGLSGVAALLISCTTPGNGTKQRLGSVAESSATGTMPYGVAIAIGSALVLFYSV